jgi:hypothetical protein
MILASPKCTFQLIAKCAWKNPKESKKTALEVVRFAKEFMPNRNFQRTGLVINEISFNYIALLPADASIGDLLHAACGPSLGQGFRGLTVGCVSLCRSDQPPENQKRITQIGRTRTRPAIGLAS